MCSEIYDEEDEDVVIQGSALHEHLSNLGYRDFESVAIRRVIYRKQKSFKYNPLTSVKNIFRKVYSICSWLLQEETVSKEQLSIILDSKTLLEDHSAAVQNSLNNFDRESWRNTFTEIVLFGAVVTSSVYFSLYFNDRISTSIAASSALFTTVCVKYSRMQAKNDMKTIVSMQNELHDLCNKGLKILRYGYRIKLYEGKGTQQIHEFTADKLKHLQPLIESLVTFFEHVSSIYYQVSLSLIRLLPADVLNCDSLTTFEDESFKIRGEITYQTLKQSYHIYVLVQSEMLHLLSVAYNVHSWQRSCSKMPEQILAYAIRRLVKQLKFHKDKLSEVVMAYYNYKPEPIAYKHKIPIASNWHDLYVHLYLTSNKLQLSYNHVQSILQDIDNNVNNTQSDEEMIETTMQKLNDAYKEIDTARNFAEFSTLLLAKTRLKNRGAKHVQTDQPNTEREVDLPRVTSQEPEIMDEVFEEYIKEEYLKPLYEEDDASPESSKWDKFLAKNFMAELKEALVDKKKSMAERESKALQRMYKNVLQDTDSRLRSFMIPPPPPSPPFLFTEQVRIMQSANQEIPGDNECLSRHNESPKCKKGTKVFGNSQSDCEVPFIPLPKMGFKPQRVRGSPFPPPFLQEDSFVGSGENSEEELNEALNKEDSEHEKRHEEVEEETHQEKDNSQLAT